MSQSSVKETVLPALELVEPPKPKESSDRSVPFPLLPPSLDGITRKLRDEDLNHPGVLRLLIDDIERLRGENKDLREVEKKYHQIDKNLAVANQQISVSTVFDIVFGLTSTAAGGFFFVNFASPFYMSVGLALFVAGVLVKWLSNRTGPL